MKENLVNFLNEFRENNDRNDEAAPLELRDYCMLLNPNFTTDHEKITQNAIGQNCLEMKNFLLEVTI